MDSSTFLMFPGYSYSTNIFHYKLFGCRLADYELILLLRTRNFNLHGSIDNHSSAITVVKVARSGREILSCGADR